MSEVQQIVRFKRMGKAITEFQRLANITTSFSPLSELQGQIQVAIDQIKMSVDGGEFKQTGLRVGQQEFITRLETQPHYIEIDPRDFLANTQGYMDEHPDTHQDFKDMADLIYAWFSTHPEVDVE